MPVDLKNKPDRDSNTDPEWFRRETDPLEDAYNTPSATDDDLPEGHPSRGGSRAALSNTDLGAAEIGGGKSQPTESDEAEKDEVAGFYSKRDAGKQGLVRKVTSSKRNKWIAGGIGATIVGTVLTFTLLLPFKVIGVVDNLRSTFGAAAEQATAKQGERITSAYIVNKVMPGMLADRACTSTRIDRSCAKVTPGDGPIATLYNAWKDGNMEKRLADKGIVIERNGTKFKMITPSTLRDGGIDLGDLDLNDIDSMDRRLLKEMSRKQVRSEFRKAYQDVTFAKRIMYRFKVDRFLERKYEIKRCLIACNLRDDRADKRDARRAAWKTHFAQRVIYPRSAINGLVLACAINDFDCTKDLGEPDEDGKRSFRLEEDVRNEAAKYVADGGKLEDLNKKIEAYKSGGLDKLLFGNVIDNAFAKGALKTIPYVGWIDLASTIFSSAQEFGPAAKKINYIVNSQAAVQTYMMYRTSADEIKAGDVDAEILGSVTNSLGPDFGTDQGGKGAEASFYYQQIMGSSGTNSASLFGSPKVHAAGSRVGCDDGKTYPSPTDVLCPEERLDTVRALTSVAGSISWLVDDSIFFLWARIQNTIWSNTAGEIIDFLEGHLADVIGDIASWMIDRFPPAQEFVEFASEIAKQVGEWTLKWFINSPLTENISGSRNFNLAAVGANVAMNDYTHYGLGGEQVSNTAMNQIRTAAEKENYQDFRSQSLLARIADKESKYSLVSKAAMSLPSTSLTGTNQSLSATLLNPFSAVSNSLISLGSSNAKAATNKNIDDAGVTQYGWDLNDPVFTDDPEKYWEREGCDDPAKLEDWANNTVENPDTGMPEHDKPFGCKLLDTSVRISGAYFTDSLLTAEELGDTEDDIDNDVGDTATGSIRVASFNVLGSCHTKPGCGSYKPGNARFELGPTRMRKQLALWDRYKLDVVGVQEFEPSQRQVVATNGASTWDLFPSTSDYDQQFSKQSIIWRKDKYELDRGGGYVIAYGNGQLKVAWAILTVKGTSTKFRVVNTHDPADARGNPAMRLAATRKHIEELQGFKQDNIPVFFVGDFNSNTNDHPNQPYPDGNDRSKSAYCLLTGSPTGTDYYRNSYDSANNSRNIPCPTHKAIGIDHVYVPKETRVTLWKSAGSQHTSDHPVVFADIAIGVEPDANANTSCSPTPNLSSVHNFRDASLSNDIIKPGVLLRSGFLAELSDADATKLSKCLGSKGTIINFLPASAQKSNDKPIPGVNNNRFAIEGSLNYAKFVHDAKRREQFGKTIEFIANSRGPVLIHCYSGKDRTGWTIAMVMYALGASKDEVLREYLLSNRDVSEQVTKQQLEVGLNAAVEKYGSIDNYLTTGLGLSQATLDALNQRLGN